MFKKVFLITALITLAVSCNQTPPHNNVDSVPIETSGDYYSDGTLELAGKIFRIEVVADDISRQIGLSGRDNIGEGSGMLFEMGVAGDHGIWMKGMKFPIDIIWIYNNQVVDFAEEALVEGDIPDTQRKVYRSRQPADKILELKSGWVSRHNVKVGDTIKFNLQ